MTPPGLKTHLLANPAVILGAWGAGGWLAYQWTQDQVAWPFVIMGGVAISSVMKAEQRVRAYRRWKRDWDSLGNRPPRRGQEQPHAHVLLTMRPLTETGFGPKSRHDWVPDPDGRTHPDGRPVMVVSNRDSWNSPEYFEQCREDWENIANAALARAGSAARIDRRSLLERGLSRLPEPALRIAWYLKELYGVMKERFGQFQMARHYRPVEQAAKDAFRRMDTSPTAADTNHQTAERFFGWFERQIARLDPAVRAPSHYTTIEQER